MDTINCNFCGADDAVLMCEGAWRGSYMLEIRRGEQFGDDWTRRAYEAIYAGEGICQLDSLYRWLLRLLRPVPGRRLLDVACGQGSLPRLAARMGLEAHGVDLSHVALQTAAREAHRAGTVAQNRTPLRFVRDYEPEGVPLHYAVADGERLPYPDSQFDYVTSVGSLEHYLDPAGGARELARVLKPDGQALVLLPNTFGLTGNIYNALKTGWPFDDGQPLQRYASRRQWEGLLEANGLRVRRVVKYEREWPTSLADALWYFRHLKPLVRLIITPFIPLNLASCFVYLCNKLPSPPAPLPEGEGSTYDV
jgi:SAM-dependent methyltransferase